MPIRDNAKSIGDMPITLFIGIKANCDFVEHQANKKVSGL